MLVFLLKSEVKKWLGRIVWGISFQVFIVLLEEFFYSSFYIDWKKKVRLVDRVQMVVPVPVLSLEPFLI